MTNTAAYVPSSYRAQIGRLRTLLSNIWLSWRIDRDQHSSLFYNIAGEELDTISASMAVA
jgi:hypothetical protein